MTIIASKQFPEQDVDIRLRDNGEVVVSQSGGEMLLIPDMLDWIEQARMDAKADAPLSREDEVELSDRIAEADRGDSFVSAEQVMSGFDARRTSQRKMLDQMTSEAQASGNYDDVPPNCGECDPLFICHNGGAECVRRTGKIGVRMMPGQEPHKDNRGHTDEGTWKREE